MTDFEAMLWLRDLFSLVPGAKDEFRRSTGINPDEAPHWLVIEGVRVAVANESARRQEEREDITRQEGYKALAQIEQAKAEALRFSLSEAARIVARGREEDSKRLESILNAVELGYKQLSSGQGTNPPALISYTDCWRKHDPNEKNPEGRPGPAQCIQTTPKQDGVHYMCLVAFSSQSPTAFARLRYQIFHEELLRQGDCPRPYSRSITRRIPLVSWLLNQPSICPLADGGEYVMKNGELSRVGD